MAAHPNYYEILDVSKTATQDEIRKAYKKLARKHHPDANADDPSALERFKQVQAAWAVLSDETKRSNFDKYGTPDEPPSYGTHPQDGGRRRAYTADGGQVPFDLEELLSGFGAGGGAEGSFRGRSEWPIRGQDIRSEIEVPFMLAAEGGSYEIRFQRSSGSPLETLSVTVPAGVDTGSVIRLSGQGTPGSNGGADGDLFVSLNVAPHPWFRREGANVLLEIPISIAECALGTKVDVPTVSDGVVTLTIPPGTSSGSKLRLRNKGIRDRRTGKHGHMLAVVKIVAPKDIDDRTKELLEELKTTCQQDCRAALWE